jgi:large subunit ribosomal protein L9
MRVILQETIEKLGERGELVEVAEGFARNYLLPRKLAIAATAGNLKQLERIRARLARRTAAEKSSADQVAAALSAVTVTLARKAGESDQLFGSVTSGDIAEALAAQGYEIDKRRVELEQPIKLLGEYPVAVRLLQSVTATVKVVVTREP